jgi:hypothetical protein
MKWLTTFILCLLAFHATAQELPEMPEVQDPESRVVPLPFILQCSPVAADQMLEQLYDELGFLEGDASIFKPDMTTANGKMRMFVDPEQPRSWTIMIEFGPELHCMVMSGENIGPMTQGTEL